MTGDENERAKEKASLLLGRRFADRLAWGNARSYRYNIDRSIISVRNSETNTMS